MSESKMSESEKKVRILQNWKMSESENIRTGKCHNPKMSESKNVSILQNKKYQNLTNGKMLESENIRTGKCQNLLLKNKVLLLNRTQIDFFPNLIVGDCQLSSCFCRNEKSALRLTPEGATENR